MGDAWDFDPWKVGIGNPAGVTTGVWGLALNLYLDLLYFHVLLGRQKMGQVLNWVDRDETAK